MTKALVTGASGFIGSTLVGELGARGIHVRALLRRTSSVANLQGLSFERVEGDLSDPDSLRRAVAGVDYVFHLAGVIAAGSREGYFEHNAKATGRLARAVAEANAGLRRFAYVSSQAAGGPAASAIPRTEADPDAPVSAYGESKRAGEWELGAYGGVFPTVILRPPIVYGPKDRAVFGLVQMVARRLMPLLKGGTPDGAKYYSVIHVSDLCRGIVEAALAPAGPGQVPSGEVFYLCGDGIHSYEAILSSMAGALGCRPIRFRVPRGVVRAAGWAMGGLGRLRGKDFPLNRDKLNELEPDYWICSSEKARRVLGFAPRFDLQAGMADTIAWYRAQKWI
jgi:nucleoside-diphosphate-sugar epimerase